MKIEKVIPSKRWKHISGRTASMYGACPWTQESDRKNWTLETIGWTWQLSNGTVGLGRMPVKTQEEALSVMEKFNSLKGNTQ